MADNVNIEAKLCSYVEGDLDPTGRAEIELYLDANPQYRPILEEMVRMRGELRALPRVKAPTDLQENLAGQLERSALLGDENLRREVGKGSRFPYARAWAAVLLLTAALAAVMYSVLPARKAKMSDLANLTTNLSEPMSTVATTSPSSNPSDSDGVANQTVAAMASTEPAAAPFTAIAAAGRVAEQSLQMQSSAQAQPQTSSVTLSQTPLQASATTLVSGSSGSSFIQSAAQSPSQSVVLPASDLPAAESRVGAYLRSQNFAFGSAPTAPAKSSVSLGDGALRAKPLGGPEVRTIVVHQLTATQMLKARTAIESIGDSGGTSAVTDTYVSFRPHARDAVGSDALANASDNPAAKLFDDRVASTMPFEGNVDLLPGDHVEVKAVDTGLAGVAAMDETMTIDPDGNISLPLVGKVHAAGMPPASLSRSIALAYEIAKSPTRANWSVRPVPTTTPAPVATRPTMTAETSLITKAVNSPVAIVQPSTSMAIDRAGQGGASLTNPKSIPPTTAASTPTTNPAANLAGGIVNSPALPPTTAAIPVDEPRQDLTIVLISTAPPATSPSTMPNMTSTTAPTTAR